MSKSLMLPGLVVTAIVTVILAHFVATELGLNRTLEYNDGQCYLLPEVKPGSEDLAVVDNDLALVSAGDLARVYFRMQREEKEGGIFALRYSEGKIQTEKIRLVGFPSNRGFFPHGIHYSNRTQRVYAISHGCGGGKNNPTYEGIDIFLLAQKQKRDQSLPTLELIYEASIEPKDVPFGSLNDVTEGAHLGEVYVSQWLPLGIHNPDEMCLDLDLKQKAMMLLTKNTAVHRCLWKGSKKEADCSVVADGFKVANGIASNPEKTEYYVADAGSKEIFIFDRNADKTNNPGALVLRDKVPLPYGVDNIEFDMASGKLTTGSVPLLYQFLQHDQDPTVKVAGGALTVEILPSGKYRVEEVLMHDGSKLNQVSSAIFWNGKVLLGSPHADGVLVCPIPKQPLSSKVV